MEFHSEWLLEDPVEILSDVKKCGISPEEIEKLSTKDNLTNLDKSLVLLESGQPCQKLWVVKNLHTIMHESRFHEIIVELIVTLTQNRLPYWSEPAQEEAGKALTHIIRSSCFPHKYTEHLINLALQIIDSETWTLQLTWARALSALCRFMPEKTIHKFLQEALALTNFHQTENIRAVGGILLGSISKCKNRADPEVTRKICSLSQDPSNFVRKYMCGPLKVLFSHYNDLKAKVTEEVLKLVADECEEVIEEAVKLLLRIFPECENKDLVLESLQEQYLDCRCNKLTAVKLKFCGPLMAAMAKVMNDGSKERWLSWAVKMTEEGGEAEKVAASSCFGGLLQAAPSCEKVLQLWALLQREPNSKVQENLATQLAFLCVYSKESNQSLPQTVKFFLSKRENSHLMVPQMIVIAGALKSFEEPLQYLLERLREPSRVRDKVETLRQLVLFLGKFPCIAQLKALFPELLSSVRDLTEPVRDKVLELLALIAYKHPGHSHRVGLFKEVVQSLAFSPNCYLRCGYIQFCLAMRSLCSMKMFCRFFMQPLLALANDKTLMVRFKFICNFVHFRFLVNEDNIDLFSSFRKILNTYLEQENKELIGQALKADEMLDDPKHYNEAYSTDSEETERQRVKAEWEEEHKEIHEPETVKKKEVEVLRPNKKVTKRKVEPIKESVRQNSVKPTKKYLIIESDRAKSNLNRSGVRTIRKK